MERSSRYEIGARELDKTKFPANCRLIIHGSTPLISKHAKISSLSGTTSKLLNTTANQNQCRYLGMGHWRMTVEAEAVASVELGLYRYQCTTRR